MNTIVSTTLSRCQLIANKTEWAQQWACTTQ